MRIIDCEQGTPEWFSARCGKVTASRVADIVRKTKSGTSKSRETYLGELVAERLSGFQQDCFKSQAMQWGSDTEAQARSTYAFVYDAKVQEVGFILHPSIEMAGASTDGLVGDDGLLEVKCPNSSTHIRTLRGESIDNDYIKQMQWGMACSGRQWCDFVSFDPRFPPDMQLHVTRVTRDEALIADLTKEVIGFLAEVDAAVAELVRLYRQPMAAE